jgi:hypothetical protein
MIWWEVCGFVFLVDDRRHAVVGVGWEVLVRFALVEVGGSESTSTGNVKVRVYCKS